MAPARSSRRAAHASQQQPPSLPVPDVQQDDDPTANKELFLDPMSGASMLMFVEKEVADRDAISRLITTRGGTVSAGYSNATFILVDPHKPSGQNLYRQYVNKKNKFVLDASWVRKCVEANELLLFNKQYGDCKVMGTETLYQAPPAQGEASSSRPVQAIHPQALQNNIPAVEALHSYPFVYTTPIHPPPRNLNAAQTSSWQNTIAPAQTLHSQPPAQSTPAAPQPHLIQRPSAPAPQSSQQQHFRDETWESYNAANEITQHPTHYDYRYREEQAAWTQPPNGYYEPAYDQTYPQPSYIPEGAEQPAAPDPVANQTPPVNQAAPIASTASALAEGSDPPRGRTTKRSKTQAIPATPASALVINRGPPARSPTPPTRVIKSTYGGNLFTADDVLYLKKYVDYCQDQGMVLSLREICERIAIKAPHHTFYSWRRYCNKHQIRLGGYMMANGRSESPSEMGDEMDIEMEGAGPSMPRGRAAIQDVSIRLNMNVTETDIPRTRSPTPPRALYRSTTGKGVAFTQADVNFLMRFMMYRKSQGSFDMVAFWKEVAVKAPHHSRASWMKFWRRHRHELERNEGDAPLPVPPEKKMRYSKADDILLAKYFVNKPGGTADKIFQDFGRLNPHHPWKGWQEHYRIHKAKIEHLMEQLAAGEDVDGDDGADDA